MPTIPLSPEFLALQRAVAGRYSLVRELGRGGMGIVYLARDVALDRLVAIKLLPPLLGGRADARDRFLREARMAASLAHPNIVPIHLVEATGEMVYFVMAYVDGETLGERVRRRGPLAVNDVMRIVQEVAWALGHAHARGVIHRDIKPDNILLERESGRAIVTDFGIARAAGSDTPGSGAPAGTPHYLAPEVARGQAGDARSDVYALGVTAWYALTGTHPFEASSVPALLVKLSSESPPSLRARVTDVPSRFANVIDRCLVKRAEDRFATAEAMAAELDEARALRPAIPGPVRAFVNEAIPAGDIVATGLAGSATAVALLATLRDTSAASGLFGNSFLAATLVPMAMVSLGIAVIRIGGVGLAARDLVEAGYGHDAARAALIRAYAERANEGSGEPLATRRRRALGYGVTGLLKEAAAIWMALTPPWLTIPGIVLAVLIPPFAGRTIWRMLGMGPGLWARMLEGRVGRAMFKVARVVARKRVVAPLAEGSTVAALGGDAEATFLRLPQGIREDLRQVPTLLLSLRRQAESLRDHADDPAVADRLATVVAAMEAMRLDLLSVEAGLVSIPDITGHLANAERLAAAIDGALEPSEPAPLTPA